MSLEFGSILPYVPLLVTATYMTIMLAVVSQAIGTVAGFGLSLCRQSGSKILIAFAFTYVWIARGTPPLIHLFLIYFGLPSFGITLKPIPAAIIALSISAAAYNAELFRAGLVAIPRGQIEAARALGMGYTTVLLRIVVPQALRVIAPPYMSNFISHVKTTSLASVITVREIILTAQLIYSNTFRAIEALLVAAGIYLFITSFLAIAQVGLEWYLAFEIRSVGRGRLRKFGVDLSKPAAPAVAAVREAAPRRATATGPKVLDIAALKKTFGAMHALRGVDLAVRQSEVLCILGPSGSGKSTLLRCINMLEQPDSGRIAIRSGVDHFRLEFGAVTAPITSRDLTRLRGRVGMVFQQFNLWPHRTALENVTEGLMRVRGLPALQAGVVAVEMLARVGLGDKLAAFPDHLSGGQRQRVAIARALAMKPSIMLFDEPTSSLDPELVGEVLQVIEDVARSGMTMLIATHEMSFARKVADRILFMDAGLVVEEASADDFFNRPKHERSIRFLEAVLH